MNQLDLTYHPYELKLNTPFETSKGKIIERRGFIISLKSSSGKIGIGDAAPFPEFGSETYDEAEKRIASIKISMRVGLEEFKDSLKALLYNFSKHPALKHGLEQALINLICNEKNITVAEALTLKLKKEIKANAAIGFLKPEEATKGALKFVKEGFRTLKIKTGRENFQDDYKTISLIRKAVGEDVNIRIDTNGKWSVDEAIKYLKRLEEFSLEYAQRGRRIMAEIRGNAILRVARKLGYQVRPPSRRKHHVIVDGPRIVTTVPKGKLKKGTLAAIIKDLGITREEFNRLVSHFAGLGNSSPKRRQPHRPAPHSLLRVEEPREVVACQTRNWLRGTTTDGKRWPNVMAWWSQIRKDSYT